MAEKPKLSDDSKLLSWQEVLVITSIASLVTFLLVLWLKLEDRRAERISIDKYSFYVNHNREAVADSVIDNIVKDKLLEIQERGIATNNRIEDLQTYGGIFVTLLLAITVIGSFKARDEAKKHLVEEFQTQRDEFEAILSEVKLKTIEIKKAYDKAILLNNASNSSGLSSVTDTNEPLQQGGEQQNTN